MITFGEKPFNNILFHGFVLDAHGIKMSKSKGNITNPFDVVNKHGRDVLRFCRGMEAALIAALGDFGIAAGAGPGKAGVWVGEKKIASLGISVRRWVTFHGFALNVNTDLTGFEVIRPCGEDPDVMTSMAAILGVPVSMDDVRRRVRMYFAEAFSLGEGAAVSR